MIPPKLPPRPGPRIEKDHRVDPDSETPIGQRASLVELRMAREQNKVHEQRIRELEDERAVLAKDLAGLHSNCRAHAAHDAGIRAELDAIHTTIRAGQENPVKLPWKGLGTAAGALIVAVWGGTTWQVHEAGAANRDAAKESARQYTEAANARERERVAEDAARKATAMQLQQFQRWLAKREADRDRAEQARVAQGGGKR